MRSFTTVAFGADKRNVTAAPLISGEIIGGFSGFFGAAAAVGAGGVGAGVSAKVPGSITGVGIGGGGGGGGALSPLVFASSAQHNIAAAQKNTTHSINRA